MNATQSIYIYPVWVSYLGNKEVVIDVIWKETQIFESGDGSFFYQLEEDVIATLVVLLVSDTRLLQ